jgi:hypothetical protein
LPIGRPAPTLLSAADPSVPPTIAPAPAFGLARPLLLASAAGVVGALGWYLSVLLTDFKLGVVAIGIGWLVGAAAVRGANGAGGIALASGAVGLALASIFLGEYLIVGHAVGALADGSRALAFGTFVARYPETVDLLDLLFYAIGAWQAWTVPAGAPRAGGAKSV